MTQPYTPPPGHPPYYPPPMPPQRSNGLATGGFVVALIGAVLSIVPFLGVVAWVIAPIGLILSSIGLTRARQQGGRGLALSGVVLGLVALVICSLWLIGFVGASSTSGSSSSSSGYRYSAPTYSAPTRSVESAPTTSAMPSVNGPFEDGTYLVGSELAAGTYRTDGSGGHCYWERLRDTTGEFDAIIATEAVSGPSTMTVQATDGAVKFRGGCTWTRR